MLQERSPSLNADVTRSAGLLPAPDIRAQGAFAKVVGASCRAPSSVISRVACADPFLALPSSSRNAHLPPPRWRDVAAARGKMLPLPISCALQQASRPPNQLRNSHSGICTCPVAHSLCTPTCPPMAVLTPAAVGAALSLDGAAACRTLACAVPTSCTPATPQPARAPAVPPPLLISCCSQQAVLCAVFSARLTPCVVCRVKCSSRYRMCGENTGSVGAAADAAQPAAAGARARRAGKFKLEGATT